MPGVSLKASSRAAGAFTEAIKPHSRGLEASHKPMTKIKVALLAVMLAIGGTTKLPAPPWGGGQTCAQITAGWSCAVSQPQVGVNAFTITANSAFGSAKLYLNGALYGTTPYTTFYLPASLHGSWRVEALSNVGGPCIVNLGTFVL